MRAAADENFMRTNGICAVVNCTPDIPNYFESPKLGGVKYMRVPIYDPGKEVDIRDKNAAYIITNLGSIINFIRQHYKPGENAVLIHCRAGIQRSAIIVVLYILTHMKHKNLLDYEFNKKKILRHIVKRRPVAFYGGHEITFRIILKLYAFNICQPQIYGFGCNKLDRLGGHIGQRCNRSERQPT
jgi:protein-tyrosine phosphatase